MSVLDAAFSRRLLLHPDKVKELKDRRSIYDKQLHQKKREFESDGRFYKNPLTDKSVIKKKIEDIDHSLTTLSPPRVVGVEKDRLWNRAKILIDELRVGMPTTYEMHPMHLNPATGVISKDLTTLDMAIKKHMFWEKKNKQKIIELKNICRTLGEPELGNIERLRSRRTKNAGNFLVK